MWADSILILVISVCTALLGEGLTWLLVYRTDKYQVQNTFRTSGKIEMGKHIQSRASKWGLTWWSISNPYFRQPAWDPIQRVPIFFSISIFPEIFTTEAKRQTTVWHLRAFLYVFFPFYRNWSLIWRSRPRNWRKRKRPLESQPSTERRLVNTPFHAWKCSNGGQF